MPSTSANNARRSPQQARATQRRARFLEVAASLIGEQGYDAVTMTAVARQAKGSIGTLYDYFPDKQALAIALLAQYMEEANAHWAALLAHPRARTNKALADLFVEGMLAFVRERPAYLPLLASPMHRPRSPEAKRPLRKTFAGALRELNPDISAERAFLIAQIIVELLKGLLSTYKQNPAKGRGIVVEEFRKLLRLYLAESLVVRQA